MESAQVNAITTTMRSRVDSYLSQQLLEQHNRIWGSYASSPSDTDTLTAASSLIEARLEGICSLILHILCLCVGGAVSFAYNALMDMLSRNKQRDGCLQRIFGAVIDFNDGIRGLMHLAECFNPQPRSYFAENECCGKSTACTSTISSLSKLSYSTK